MSCHMVFFFFFQAEDGIRDSSVTGVQTCALPIFANADHVVRLRLVNQRLAPSSIEPRACMFDFDPASSQLSAWISSQVIYSARDTLARYLGLAPGQVRVHNAEVGGAFGAKARFLGEEIIA